MTPKGTRPGQASSVAHEAHAPAGVTSSSRYTPPNPQSMYESPRWVPVTMIALIAIAVVAILLRYLVWTGSNVPVVVGLVFLLAGLFVATKWH